MRRYILTALVFFQTACFAQGWEWQNPLPHGNMINDILMMDWNAVVAVCDNGFLLRSWDGGKTWLTTSVGMKNHSKILSLYPGELLVASNQEAIYRTTDFGETWTTVYDRTTQSLTFADVIKLGDDHVLATLGGNRILESTDRGITWTQVFLQLQGSETIRSVAARSASDWFVITNRNVYHSTDAGVLWTIEPTYVARGLQKLVFFDTSYGYQLREGQVLQTKDGGASWMEMNVFGFDINVDIAVQGNTIYTLSAGKFIVNKSTDDGVTWNISLPGTAFSEAYPSAISFISPDRGVIAGEGGRVLRTDDGGITWSITHGLGYLGPIADMYFISSQVGFALSYSETLLLTTNGGRRWDESIPAPGYSLREMHFFNDREGFAVGLDARYISRVFYTSDRGRTWVPRGVLPIVQDIFRNVQPQGILAISSDTVFVPVSYGDVYRSVNGGETWDSLLVSIELTSQWYSGLKMIHFPPSHIIHVSADGISSSTDMGNSWTYYRSAQGRFLTQPHFFSKTEGAALLSGSPSFTTDGGKSWSIGSPGGLQLLWFFDRQRGMAFYTRYKGEEIGNVMHTWDGGATWTEYTTRERPTFTDWVMISPDEGWAFGQGGMIRHTKNGGVTSVRNERTIADGFHLGVPYPNPFSAAQHGVLSIPFMIGGTHAQRVKLDLYTTLGTHVTTLLNRALEPGSHVVTADASRLYGLPAGTYFLRAESGGTITTTQLIIVR